VRSPSPQSKQPPESEQDSAGFRDRSRHEYEEKRNLGRLAGAMKTCRALDETDGIDVRNVNLKLLMFDVCLSTV
jgi:hypothetical protein